MTKKRILAVDDDPLVLKLVTEHLKSSYVCKTATTGEKGLRLLWSFNPDLLILDLILPRFNGQDMLRLIRADPRVGALRILVLTADTREETVKKCFRAGADDCMKKPFSLTELEERISNSLAHIRPLTHTILSHHGIVLDVKAHTVRADDAKVHLTPTEFVLLRKLLEDSGTCFFREDLIEILPGAAHSGGTRALDIHIGNLRKKLRGHGKLIETVHEFGYRLR